jgi:hypothetical protein
MLGLPEPHGLIDWVNIVGSGFIAVMVGLGFIEFLIICGAKLKKSKAKKR